MSRAKRYPDMPGQVRFRSGDRSRAMVAETYPIGKLGQMRVCSDGGEELLSDSAADSGPRREAEMRIALLDGLCNIGRPWEVGRRISQRRNNIVVLILHRRYSDDPLGSLHQLHNFACNKSYDGQRQHRSLPRDIPRLGNFEWCRIHRQPIDRRSSRPGSRHCPDMRRRSGVRSRQKAAMPAQVLPEEKP